MICVSVLLFFCNCNQTSQQKSPDNTSLEIPGYYEQWLYMKTNGSNILPDLSRYNWMPSNIKRATSNALLSVDELGPDNVGGRTRAAIVDISNPNRIIAGGVSGGLFISEDKGQKWTAINDHQLTPSVTGMDQNPLNPDIIYYCTGEGAGNSANIPGAGIFKSTDHGKTFSQLSATNTLAFTSCWSIKCSQKDTHVLYVATDEAGLWRSNDSGITFTKVFATTLEINDLEVFPNGSVLIGVKGLGVYYSADGNAGTFSKIATIASSSIARIELAYCKNFPSVVYAAVSGPDNSYYGNLSNFYKSSDGGKTFKERSNPDGVVTFGFTWYCLTMTVKNNDSNALFIASLNAGYSTDGGNSWNYSVDMHADHHLAVNINDNELLVGNDGGLCLYQWNDLTSFLSLNNAFNITQFYSGAVSPHNKNLMGGCQDNGTRESYQHMSQFDHIFGGDGGYAYYHQSDPDIRYLSTQNGFVYRTSSNFTDIISDYLPNTTDPKWFIHPYTVSDYNGDLICYPANKNIYFSKDQGSYFEQLGNITTGRLFASEFSGNDNPSLITGGNNCLIAFDSVLNTVPIKYNHAAKLPYSIRISFLGCIKIIPGSRDKAYLAYTNISDSGRLYKATNLLSANPVFKNISGNLPKGLPVNWVECDPLNPEMTLFAGTDLGLYVTEDGGITWIKDSRVPSVVINTIKIRNNQKEIYFFTHGRGIFKGLINNNANVAIQSVNNGLLGISTYPNPCSDMLNITVGKDYENGRYTLYNVAGQSILSGLLSDTKTSISISAIQPGRYLLVLSNNGKQAGQSIVIAR